MADVSACLARAQLSLEPPSTPRLKLLTGRAQRRNKVDPAAERRRQAEQAQSALRCRPSASEEPLLETAEECDFAMEDMGSPVAHTELSDAATDVALLSQLDVPVWSPYGSPAELKGSF